jgi:glycosyltransferase involved in cell wall biosynthesis
LDQVNPTANKQQPIKVFVPLITPFFYGMERSVITCFEIMQPEIKPHFLLTYTTYRLNLPILNAIKNTNISYSFLSDKKDWPAIGKPHSLSEALAMIKAIILGNRDALLASYGNDIFYIPSFRVIYLVLLMIIFNKLRRKHIVYVFHDTINRPSRLLKLFRVFISHYVFLSEYAKAQFETYNPWVLERNSLIIPNVVAYTPSSADCPLPLDSRIILFVGQIAKYKGVDLLIEAFHQIKASYADVTLHFVGSPHKDFEDDFMTAINDPETEGRITYWGFREDIYDLFKGAYIFVQPSRPSMFAESFGRGVIEAMAAGVPSICFHSGALPEHVIQGETGLVCEEESANCLAKQLCLLLDNPSLRDTYARQARIRYENYYAPEKIREHWIEFYRSMRKHK